MVVQSTGMRLKLDVRLLLYPSQQLVSTTPRAPPPSTATGRQHLICLSCVQLSLEISIWVTRTYLKLKLRSLGQATPHYPVLGLSTPP